MATSRMGRPKSPPHERLRNRVTVGLNDAELEQLESAAGHDSPSSYLRRLLLKHLAAKKRKR